MLFGVAALLLLLATFPMEMMVVLSLCYLATIPSAIQRFRAYERADSRREAAAEPDPVGSAPMSPLS